MRKAWLLQMQPNKGSLLLVPKSNGMATLLVLYSASCYASRFFFFLHSTQQNHQAISEKLKENCGVSNNCQGNWRLIAQDVQQVKHRTN